jgi:hemerythrin-like domain-containing protein
LLEREKFDLRNQLPDYHVLRKVMAEHDMLRCFLADLEDVGMQIQQSTALGTASIEFMRLSHIVEHLNSLDEHICREDDVLFPTLKEQGWASLFEQIQSEHTYIQMAVNDLVKLVMAFNQMPFVTFKTRLLSTIRYLCPLLREHLFHEDRVLFPLAIASVQDAATWERLRRICNEIDYCGIHL